MPAVSEISFARLCIAVPVLSLATPAADLAVLPAWSFSGSTCAFQSTELILSLAVLAAFSACALIGAICALQPCAAVPLPDALGAVRVAAGFTGAASTGVGVATAAAGFAFTGLSAAGLRPRLTGGVSGVSGIVLILPFDTAFRLAFEPLMLRGRLQFRCRYILTIGIFWSRASPRIAIGTAAG